MHLTGPLWQRGGNGQRAHGRTPLDASLGAPLLDQCVIEIPVSPQSAFCFPSADQSKALMSYPPPFSAQLFKRRPFVDFIYLKSKLYLTISSNPLRVAVRIYFSLSLALFLHLRQVSLSATPGGFLAPGSVCEPHTYTWNGVWTGPQAWASEQIHRSCSPVSLQATVY